MPEATFAAQRLTSKNFLSKKMPHPPTPAGTAVAPASTSAGALSDFPDWLSPILVKEIRQGLRERVFVITFIVLHFVLMAWTVSAGFSESARGLDFIFWIFPGVGLLAIAVRASSFIHAEKKANTLKLLQITRQTPWEIVAGKWFAVAVQAALFVSSLLPYLLLRYYTGSLAIFQDLLALACVFAGACGMAAFATWVSSLHRVLGLLLYMLVMLQAAAWLLQLLLFTIVSSFSGGMMPGNIFSFSQVPPDIFATITLGVVGVNAIHVFLFLSLAAGRIVLGTERVAAHKRIAGWLALLPAAGAGVCGAEKGVVVVVLFLSALPAVLVLGDAMFTSTTPSVPSFKKFGRRGFFGQLAALFFAPSQSCGMIYAAATFAAAAAIAGGFVATGTGLKAGGVFALFNVFFLPLALSHLRLKLVRMMPVLLRYLIFAGAEAGFVGICTGLGSFGILPLWNELSMLSPVGVLLYGGSIHPMQTFSILIVHAVIAGALLFNFFVKDFRATRKMMRGERAELPMF